MNIPASGNWLLFSPPRRRGVLLHGGAALLCASLLALCLSLAVEQPPGLAIIGLVFGALLAALPLPILLYRLYGLLQSAYWLGRDGLRLHWGLRQLDLPYEAVLDVARADELAEPLPLPAWDWTGSLVARLQDAELGALEYLAADGAKLVLLGTQEAVYVISPEDPKAFVVAYKRQSERGSLRPLVARSVTPSFVLAEAWSQSFARRLLLAGAGLSLALLVLVGILAPGSPGVSLGFSPDGQPLPVVSGVQLFLLPVLNLFFYVGNFALGLLFYREKRGGLLASLMWGASLVTTLLFLAAVLASLVTHVA